MNRLNLKTIIAFIALLSYLQTTYAQKIDLDNFEMEVLEAFNKNSVGTAFTFAGKKYVGLEVLLIPKIKKNDGFNLGDLQLKSENNVYYLIYKKGMTVYLIKGGMIRQRKPKKVLIFAEVDKDMTNAILYYKENAIVEIKVNNNNKIGTYKLL